MLPLVENDAATAKLTMLIYLGRNDLSQMTIAASKVNNLNQDFGLNVLMLLPQMRVTQPNYEYFSRSN